VDFGRQCGVAFLGFGLRHRRNCATARPMKNSFFVTGACSSLGRLARRRPFRPCVLMRPEINQGDKAEQGYEGERNHRNDHLVRPPEPGLLGTVGRDKLVDHPVRLSQVAMDFNHG